MVEILVIHLKNFSWMFFHCNASTNQAVFQSSIPWNSVMHQDINATQPSSVLEEDQLSAPAKRLP
jgi:hypothetical protein